jgi:hypothetical protein
MSAIAEASVPGLAFSIAERKRRSDGGGITKFAARMANTPKVNAAADFRKHARQAAPNASAVTTQNAKYP